MWIRHHHGLQPPLIPSFSIFGQASERQRQTEVSHQESCSSSSFIGASLHLFSEPRSLSSVMRCMILFPEMRAVNASVFLTSQVSSLSYNCSRTNTEEPCDNFSHFTTCFRSMMNPSVYGSGPSYTRKDHFFHLRAPRVDILNIIMPENRDLFQTGEGIDVLRPSSDVARQEVTIPVYALNITELR
jgi:hypothetical protein